MDELRALVAKWRKEADENRVVCAENLAKMQRGEMVTFTTVSGFTPVEERFADELEQALAAQPVPAEGAQAWREALRDEQHLLQAVKDAVQRFPLGHSHWDSTMQYGRGCELCQNQQKAKAALMELLTTAPAALATRPATAAAAPAEHDLSPEMVEQALKAAPTLEADLRAGKLHSFEKTFAAPATQSTPAEPQLCHKRDAGYECNEHYGHPGWHIARGSHGEALHYWLISRG
jgi:hypothetical protein